MQNPPTLIHRLRLILIFHNGDKVYNGITNIEQPFSTLYSKLVNYLDKPWEFIPLTPKKTRQYSYKILLESITPISFIYILFS